MKHITYKFTDGSEIDIDNFHNATITGHTKQFVYQFWDIVSKPKTPRGMKTAIFVALCEAMHAKHGIVLEHTDHFTGITVNHFDNLISQTR